jgi:hypothetical protein
LCLIHPAWSNTRPCGGGIPIPRLELANDAWPLVETRPVPDLKSILPHPKETASITRIETMRTRAEIFFRIKKIPPSWFDYYF